jgi:hypothetical protein
MMTAPSAPAVARRPGPFAEAWARMRALFRPFRPGLYLGLAAVALVARCGEGCGSSFVQLPAPGTEEAGGDPIEAFRLHLWWTAFQEWAKEHAAEIVAAAIALVLVAVAAGILVALVQAFFRFVFLRTCWEGRLAVAADIRRDAGRAVGLFGWNLCVGLAVAAFALVVVVAAVTALFAALFAMEMVGLGDSDAVAGLVGVLGALGIVFALIGLFLLFAFVRFMTHDLVVAQAALAGTGIVAAWRAVLRRARAAPGDLLGYVFFRLLGGAAVGLAETIIGLVLWIPFIVPFFLMEDPGLRVILVALVAAIPYAVAFEAIVTVVLLPLLAWLRLAAPCYLAGAAAPAAPPPAVGFCGGCGAPLRPEARFCGRCGRPA